MTFYSGLFFLKTEISGGMRFVIFLFIIVINLWFLSFWVFMLSLQFSSKCFRTTGRCCLRCACRKVRADELIDKEAEATEYNSDENHKND